MSDIVEKLSRVLAGSPEWGYRGGGDGRAVVAFENAPMLWRRWLLVGVRAGPVVADLGAAKIARTGRFVVVVTDDGEAWAWSPAATAGRAVQTAAAFGARVLHVGGRWRDPRAEDRPLAHAARLAGLRVCPGSLPAAAGALRRIASPTWEGVVLLGDRGPRVPDPGAVDALARDVQRGASIYLRSAALADLLLDPSLPRCGGTPDVPADPVAHHAALRAAVVRDVVTGRLPTGEWSLHPAVVVPTDSGDVVVSRHFAWPERESVAIFIPPRDLAPDPRLPRAGRDERISRVVRAALSREPDAGPGDVVVAPPELRPVEGVSTFLADVRVPDIAVRLFRGSGCPRSLAVLAPRRVECADGLLRWRAALDPFLDMGGPGLPVTRLPGGEFLVTARPWA